MSVDWPKVALTEIYTISSGLSKPADSFGSGYPFLSFKEVFGNYFIPDKLAQLVESTEKERDKGSVKRGDVFLTRTSETMHELGMSSVALKDYPEATFNGFSKRLRPKESSLYEVYPEFIGYCLRSQKFRRGMLAFSTMSTRASLNNDMISRLSIELPPIGIQKNIAKVLKSLDDKIALNHKTNQTLEQIAQALFKSWFIDFDPTRAKIAAKQAGQDPERAAMAAISGKTLDELDQLNSAQLEQLKTTAALFPDGLVDSELGEVPEGWTLDELRNIAEFSTGRIDSSELTIKTYISTENMLEGRKGISIASSLPSTKTVPSFSYKHILISNIRPYFMKIWLAQFEGGRSNDVLGIKAKESESIEYLYNLLYQNEFFNFMMATSKGAKMPRGDKDAIMGWICIQPPLEVKNAYSEKVNMFYKIINITNKENETLETIRDTLLPKLLSGELSTNQPKVS